MHAKQVVFNVGGALSIYTELDDRKIFNDLGKSGDFNPVTDFLLPLLEKRADKSSDGKYHINQLIMSHPHNDHISAICDFDKYFFAEYVTCPNGKKRSDSKKGEAISWPLTGIDVNDGSIDCYKDMYKRRKLPLRKIIINDANYEQNIFWIPPAEVKRHEEVMRESYANNVSLVTHYKINGSTILIPGDMQKVGMKHILKNDYRHKEEHMRAADTDLKVLLGEGLDILITPHHGHSSSFCEELYGYVMDGKVRCLNIIPERIDCNGESDVCNKYHTPDYCYGINNLNPENGENVRYAAKTSNGHICIDYSLRNCPTFHIFPDINDVISWFLEN